MVMSKRELKIYMKNYYVKHKHKLKAKKRNNKRKYNTDQRRAYMIEYRKNKEREPCHICNKSFGTIYDLKRHEKTMVHMKAVLQYKHPVRETIYDNLPDIQETTLAELDDLFSDTHPSLYNNSPGLYHISFNPQIPIFQL